MFSSLSLSGPKLTTRVVAFTAILIALKVVLSKISIGSDTLVKVSLGFIATAIIGYYLGPWISAIAMALSDIILHTIFSHGEPLFLGFTFSAAIAGIIAGAILYNKKVNWKRIFVYEFIQTFISNLIFNTLWIHMMYHAPLSGLLAVRLPKEIICYPFEAVALLLVLKAIERTNLKLDKAGY